MGEDPDCEPRYLNCSLGFAGSELVQRTELKYLENWSANIEGKKS